MIAAAAVVLFAVATPIYLSQASAVDGGYAVSQPVPDRAASHPAVSRVRVRHQARIASPIPTRERIATAALDGDQALATAWRTGEPQEWAAHGEFGIIVPGAIEQADGMACRSLSRLTRHPGAPDTVARSRQCAVAPVGDQAEAVR